MKDWYALTNDLDTPVPPLGEATQTRIWDRVKGALPRRKRRFSLAAVIAAALLLTACGAAVVTGQFSDWFWNISQDVRAPEESQDLFAELGTVIGQSQTVGDVTMTLDGALWDGEYLFLSLLVDGLEGETFCMDKFTSLDSWLGGSKDFNYERMRNLFPKMTDEEFENYWEMLAPFQRPGITFLVDRETGEHRLLVQRTLEGQEKAELTLHLENLKLQGETIEGPFEFTFTVTPKSMTQVYTGDVVFEGEGIPSIRVTEVRIDPFKVELDFTTLEEDAKIDLKEIDVGTLLVGEKETTGSSSSGLSVIPDESGRTDYTLRDGPFRQVVDPRAVTAIGINGGWLELDQFELSS